MQANANLRCFKNVEQNDFYKQTIYYGLNIHNKNKHCTPGLNNPIISHIKLMIVIFPRICMKKMQQKILGGCHVVFFVTTALPKLSKLFDELSNRLGIG